MKAKYLTHEHTPPLGARQISTADLPTREAMADKLFSDSCTELAKIRDMLTPAFTRHQKALDATAEYGRDNNYQRGMGPLLTEAWREFQVKRTVEAERRK